MMEETGAVHLDLRAPLYYTEAPELFPFTCIFPENESGRELLFCFEIESEQAGRIDPAPGGFLGDLVFSGQGDGRQGKIVLPAGFYLFSQRRQALDREESINLAIEQQKDGLWERLSPENSLYIRFLFEDGSPVTQVFRKYTKN